MEPRIAAGARAKDNIECWLLWPSRDSLVDPKSFGERMGLRIFSGQAMYRPTCTAVCRSAVQSSDGAELGGHCELRWHVGLVSASIWPGNAPGKLHVQSRFG